MMEQDISWAELQEQYKNALSSALTSWLGFDLGSARYASVYTSLKETDFFLAPASTKYHEVFMGGLCAHSLKVAHIVKKLSACELYHAVSLPQAIVCALLHDVCKINTYESYNRNIKNTQGVWEQVEAFRHKDDINPSFGHGEDSAFWVKEHLPETTEEMLLAIRWHMGAWDCTPSAHIALSKANVKYPLVHLLQFADQLSITDYAQ